MIGDAQSTVLANGTFMLASCCADPAADALLDATTLTWTTTGAPSAGAGYQDEQGYELLPNGNVLTVDIWTKYNSKGDATNAERYSQSAGTWSSAGNTPVSLPDPYACGISKSGRLCCGATARWSRSAAIPAARRPRPIRPQSTSIKTNKWSSRAERAGGLRIGRHGELQPPDSPAALLPNGNILFAASANFGGIADALLRVHHHQHDPAGRRPAVELDQSGAYYYNFLVLPNGQILTTDFSKDAEVYTPAGSPVAAWRRSLTRPLPRSLPASPTR